MSFRVAWMVALAACSTPTKPPPQTIVPPPPTTGGTTPPAGGAAIGGPALAPTVKQVDSRPIVETPHAGAIKLVAATSDGAAALTVDDIDGLRLWPKLDGTVEPRIVELERPKMLSLGRDGANFLVALLDDVGGLVIATLDEGGRTLQRTTLPPEPGFLGAVVVGGRILAWRADQFVFLLDKSGATLGQLATDAGERVATIAVAGERAVAVVETATDTTIRRRPRPILLDKLAWGARVDTEGDLGTNVALSPSGKRFAALATDAPKQALMAFVWDLDKKQLIATHPVSFATGVALPNDDQLVLVQPGAHEIIELATEKPASEKIAIAPFVAPQRAPFAVGGGRVIAGRNDELALVTKADTKYLGYGLEAPQVASVGTGGQLLIGLGETFALLDRDLKEIAAPTSVVPPQSNITELHWLAGSDWIVESSSASDGKTTIAIADIAKNTRKDLRTNLPVAQLVMYEPETKLVTFSLGEAPEVARYSPDKRQLDKLVTLARPNGFEQRELIPLAPSLAGGAQVLSVQMRDKTTIRWAASPTNVETGPSVVVDGSLAGVDRAGHVFVWQNGADHKLVLAVYDRGKQTGTLPTDGTTTIWPDPRGTRALLLTGRAATLVGMDGKKLWDLVVQGATEAQWLDDGTLALISSGGIARVDVAKGAVTATRCGWRFGLTAQPHPFASRIEPLCTAR